MGAGQLEVTLVSEINNGRNMINTLAGACILYIYTQQGVWPIQWGSAQVRICMLKYIYVCGDEQGAVAPGHL